VENTDNQGLEREAFSRHRRTRTMKRIVGLLAAGLMVMSSGAFAQTVPIGPAGGFASEDVEYVGFVPFEAGTSTGVTIQGKVMYQTSWKNISVYDISNPESPELLDTAPVGFWFENENVQVTPDGNNLFFAESLPGTPTPDGPRTVLHVWDVEDKTNIQEVATLEGAGDHTTSCILKCKFLYGSDGSIVDVRNPADPKLIAANDGDDKKKWTTIATGQNYDNHDVEEVKNGFILDAPIDGDFHYIDVRNPKKPKVVAHGVKPMDESSDAWLFHSGDWPRNAKDNFILQQGEDNANPQCSEDNGPIQTYSTKGWQKTRTFQLVDTFRVENGTYADGSPAANGLGCSAHWFEVHPTWKNGGLVAVGYYEHGTRFLSVNKKGKIKEAGYFLPFGGSTSAAYWPETSKKTEIVYAVDYTRGIDILRWTGPKK
jgi:hypothetical protein